MDIINSLNHVIARNSTRYWLLDRASAQLPARRFDQSRVLYEEICGQKTAAWPQGWRTVHASNGPSLNLIEQPYPQEIWRELPIPSHRLKREIESMVPLVEEALEEMQNLFPRMAASFAEVAYNLVFVELPAEVASADRDSLITSASFPKLPLTIFVSEKSFFHIPPNTVAKQPSIFYFLENLFHESLHQMINLCLFGESVFPEVFDARKEEKIPIPWRTSSGARNRAWELDRTFHAYAVYLGLLQFRRELILGGSLNATETTMFKEALQTARAATTYLGEQLRERRSAFSAAGRDLLQELCAIERRHA